MSRLDSEWQVTDTVRAVDWGPDFWTDSTKSLGGVSGMGLDFCFSVARKQIIPRVDRSTFTLHPLSESGKAGAGCTDIVRLHEQTIYP